MPPTMGGSAVLLSAPPAARAERAGRPCDARARVVCVGGLGAQAHCSRGRCVGIGNGAS